MKQQKITRRIELLLLILVTLLLAVMGVRYYFNIKPELDGVTEGYKKGAIVNLAAPLQAAALNKVLENGDYFTDKAYNSFATGEIVKRINEQGSIKNLGALNKKAFNIPASDFLKNNSLTGKLRFINSLAHLEMDSALYDGEKNNPKAYPATVAVNVANSDISIDGAITIDGKAAEGTLVQLSRVFPENDTTLTEDSTVTAASFFARTDKNGEYHFTNIIKGAHYSVLPLKPGFEFGATKGTANIEKDRQFNFSGKPHELRVLDRVTYRQIKADKVLTVRTPDSFYKNFITHMLCLIAGFWLLHFVLLLKRMRSDQFLLPILMFITGVGVVVLYSVQDPVRDEIFADAMAQCIAGSLLVSAIAVLFLKSARVNQFYHSALFDPLHRILPFTDKRKEPRGYTWLLLAILCMLTLAAFGTGPEGSGVKVNVFGVQVSEVAKLLMIIFFAAYFTVNIHYFRNIKDNRWLTKNNAVMLGLFAFLLGLYAYLGDLGPAVVLCLTFLFFYAFAKSEFLQMLLAAIGYVAVLFFVAKFSNNVKSVLPIIALAAVILSFGFVFWQKRYESVFFIILIISSFILLGSLPFSFTQRLADRNDMFSNIWENTLTGGDQIAHGVWSLNTGGFLGQGLGRGFSNAMPAYHTDMIVQSIGEELGIVALIALFLAFGLLVYRSILVARRTGKTFLFYLVAGIAIATMIQFMIIVAGTLGLIPLTGISVPFLSKGNAGIIVTMLSFLLILFVSNEKGDAMEMEFIKTHFDHINASVILSFFGGILVFIGALCWYQYKSNEYIVKPALVLNKEGSWQYSYNPRIGIMLREVQPGNIYDKNGVLLATSDRSALTRQKNNLLASGVSNERLNQLLKQDIKRYYPFGEKTIFWLADLNREIAREEHNGYAAEYRHFTLLRGFDVSYTTTQKTTDRYKENKFLPEQERESELVNYDYSALAPFIKAGKNSALLDSQYKKKRDIYLSLDVKLNDALFTILQKSNTVKNFRTSVVAINPATGDVLSSASNPAPSFNDLKLVSNIDPLEYRAIFKQLFNPDAVVAQDLGVTYNSRPGSAIKILDAFAAYNQYGMLASNISFFVAPGEVIRAGEPSNTQVNMRDAIVHSSNVYFIKLANEKNLQAALFYLYDATGMNILNRGGFHFQKPADYDSAKYFKEWDNFLKVGKGIYNSKRLEGSKKRFQSHYSNIAWGQGELMATPLQMAKITGTIANNGVLQPSRFLFKTWNDSIKVGTGERIAKTAGMTGVLGEMMKEQSAKLSAATGLTVHGKTGSPERDKLIKENEKTVRKRVTDAWYTFYVSSPRIGAPLVFTIRIEAVGNSDYAKELAKEILLQLKTAGYF